RHIVRGISPDPHRSTPPAAVRRAVAAGDAPLDQRAVRVGDQNPVAAVVLGVVGVAGVVGGEAIGDGDVPVGVVVGPTLPRPIDVNAVIHILAGRAAPDVDVAEAGAAPVPDGGAGHAVRDATNVEAGPSEPAGLDPLDPDVIQPTRAGAAVEHQ